MFWYHIKILFTAFQQPYTLYSVELYLNTSIFFSFNIYTLKNIAIHVTCIFIKKYHDT